jgi:Na+-driven multidrug efflux pump
MPAMRSASTPLTLGRIFRFWIPMAGTWLMMSVEGPFVAAIIARLTEPKYNLAAFGVAFAVAILVESPVIMILSASTALVEGPVSFRRLRNFTFALNLAVTLAMLGLLLTPTWRVIAGAALGLPPPVVDLTQVALLLLLPWPAAIGYRRFYHGLLIRGGLTRRVAYGTVVRLAFMATTSLVLFLTTRMPGAWVGATALSAGVMAEAVISRLMVRHVVREVLSGPAGNAVSDESVTYRKISNFYAPLALTSLISLAAHPMVTFSMGHARFALESLAVLPVVNALSFIFRSAGLSYQEVAIALLARDPRNSKPVTRFAFLLAVGASLGMGLIAFTPLAWIWFRDVSNLSADLVALALAPTRILTLLPALSVLLSLQRAFLVAERKTAPITWATLIEIGGIVAGLVLLIGGLDLVGATAAALAFIFGRVAGNLYLTPPCLRVLQRPLS